MEEKDLEKMTVTKLREEALKIPELTEVHAMKKAELIAAIRKARRIPEKEAKPKELLASEIKAQIKKLRAEKEAALDEGDKKKIKLHRTKIKKLKRQTRRLAVQKAAK